MLALLSPHIPGEYTGANSSTVTSNIHLITQAFEHANCDLSIHNIILREQDTALSLCQLRAQGMCWVTMVEDFTCRLLAASAGQADGAGTRHFAVNQNVDPTPTSLVPPVVPPISSASRRVMESPRPVPPNLRVVVLST